MKRLAPLVLAVPLLLAGCSSGENDTEAAAPTTEAAPQTDWEEASRAGAI